VKGPGWIDDIVTVLGVPSNLVLFDSLPHQIMLGMSGGPVVDKLGKVIGVLKANKNGNQFAISIEHVISLIRT